MRIIIFTLNCLMILLIAPLYTFAQQTIPSLVKKVQPSVVLITTYDSNGDKLGSGSGFL